ncbi:peptidase m61 domain-containing protein [Colletotrichum truncatum]|uniref:Peptidase m61 domain-containing protein n=1 Tax=Colletotrichum truncatum TaxID=5467 RepID=A0ACC3YFH2_COLTU|nr:peptidase m61 domain-containing protein [Colletotrichum truncatum]KAF6788336.1 peptidase m61 domain-containing protein [Colletotrichum truncatum]
MQLPPHPILSLQLTPSFDSEEVKSLAVSFRVQNPVAEADQPIFSFYPFKDNVPAHPFRESDITATDDAGSLSIHFREVPSEGRNTQQHWYFDRKTQGDVILHYEVFPRHVDVTTPLGARIDLRRDQGGVHGVGQWFLPLLISDKVFTNVVRWKLPVDAPETTRCVWSYGEGTKAIVRIGSSETLWNTVYMVGPVQCYPEVPPDSDEGFAACYWFGELPENLDQLKGYNTALFPKLATFFESPGESYRIFIRKSPVGFGGSGFDASYVLEYDNATKNETEDSLVLLFTHEMVHSFANISPEEDGYENEWFIEGIAEYYSSFLPYRFGFRGKDFLIHSLNVHLQGYYTSPRITIDVQDAAKIMFTDWYAEWISYKRGFAYLLFIDLSLRKHCGRHDISKSGPLDEIVVDLSKRYRQGETVRSAQWLESLRKYFGENGFQLAKQYEDMLRGRLIMDFSGLFLEQASKPLKACQLPIIQYGFDRRSVSTRIVTGVIENSPAAAAGLWDGAHIISTSRASLCMDDMSNKYKLVVQDGDQERTIEYIPRLKQTAGAWQLEE